MRAAGSSTSDAASESHKLRRRWWQFSLRALLACCLLLAVVIGINREPLAWRLGLEGGIPPLMEIDSEERLEEALASPRAVVFASVDWSIYSVNGKKQLAECARAWRGRFYGPHVDFYILDLTEQGEIPEYVREWAASDSRLPLMGYSGYGEAAWLKAGTVVDFHATHDKTPAELTAITEACFLDQ